MTARNSTDDTDTDQLRRDFVNALSDVLKGDAKIAAGSLDVVRRYLADRDAQARWTQEQAALAAGASGASAGAPAKDTEVTTEADSDGEYVPPVPASMANIKLPFPVKRGATQKPPAKAAEGDTGEDRDWSKLTTPFLAP